MRRARGRARAARTLLAALLFTSIVPATTASAQATSDVARCVNGAPALTSSDGRDLPDLLKTAIWPGPGYDSVLIADGAGATMTLFRTRAAALVTSAISLSDAAARAKWIAVDSVLREIERVLVASPRGRHPDANDLIAASALRPDLMLTNPNAVTIADLPFAFDGAERVSSIAICAVARSATTFVEFVQKDALDSIAHAFRQTAERWDAFAASTYSMTFVERLAASCRLPFVDWLLSPTSRCWSQSKRKWTMNELHPPRLRTVFVHPTAGLEPILKSDSTYRSVAVVEWYGLLWHRYRGTKIRTWGATLASAHYESDRSRLGGVLHTPLAKIGAFDNGHGRTIVIVSADVLGWLPGARAAALRLRATAVERELQKLRAPE